MKIMLKKEQSRFRFQWIRPVAILLSVLSVLFTERSLYSAVADSKTNPVKVQLYFAVTDQPFLTAEERMLKTGTDPAELAKSIIEALIEGPREDLMATLPKETRVKGVYLTADGTAYVDFSNEVRDRYPGGCGMEVLSLYSVANSLILNIERIKSVKILIGGREAQTLAGHVDIRFPFSANMLIIK